MSDDATETTTQADASTTLCNWLIILTTLTLIVAIVVLQNQLKDQYQLGWFK